MHLCVLTGPPSCQRAWGEIAFVGRANARGSSVEGLGQAHFPCKPQAGSRKVVWAAIQWLKGPHAKGIRIALSSRMSCPQTSNLRSTLGASLSLTPSLSKTY